MGVGKRPLELYVQNMCLSLLVSREILNDQRVVKSASKTGPGYEEENTLGPYISAGRAFY